MYQRLQRYAGIFTSLEQALSNCEADFVLLV